MIDWKSAIVKDDTSVMEVVNLIDRVGLKIALVTNANNQLIGIVTDGDIRRGLLKHVDFSKSVTHVMQSNPKVATINDSKHEILSMMQDENICHVPILDHHGMIVGLEMLEEVIKTKVQDYFVVLMAGGLGSRLSPLTDACPKPLLKLGCKPMLQIIMENFAEYGFRKFYLCVNYKAKMIEEYFGDGQNFGFEIHYIHEEKQLGTAGALTLLPTMNQPFIVMNSDLLTKINFQSLIEYHLEYQSHATMCVKEYDFQVPYGVVRLEHNRIMRIDEKPIQRFFVNAGIYVLNSSLLALIPKNEYCDMPTLFDIAIQQALKTISFPIREYWLDIGRHEDLVRARNDYVEHF